MSTILRALRRLEQEKAADELVELHESVVAPAPVPERRRVRSVMLVALAAVFAAGLGGAVTWRLLGGADGFPFAATPVELAASAPSPVVADESPSDEALENALAVLKPDTAILVDRRDRSARLAPVAAPPPERAVAPEVADREPEISSEVVVLERVPDPSDAAAADSIAAARRLLAPEPVLPDPEPRDKPEPRVLTKLGPKPGARYAKTPAAEPAPEPQRIAAARSETPPEPMPATRRQSVAPAPASIHIPDVIVTKTIWHPSSERRSAIVEVEGRPEPLELREGDVVGDLVLTQIKPSGVVFDYEGVELVRKIGGR